MSFASVCLSSVSTLSQHARLKVPSLGQRFFLFLFPIFRCSFVPFSHTALDSVSPTWVLCHHYLYRCQKPFFHLSLVGSHEALFNFTHSWNFVVARLFLLYVSVLVISLLRRQFCIIFLQRLCSNLCDQSPPKLAFLGTTTICSLG